MLVWVVPITVALDVVKNTVIVVFFGCDPGFVMLPLAAHPCDAAWQDVIFTTARAWAVFGIAVGIDVTWLTPVGNPLIDVADGAGDAFASGWVAAVHPARSTAATVAAMPATRPRAVVRVRARCGANFVNFFRVCIVGSLSSPIINSGGDVGVERIGAQHRASGAGPLRRTAWG